MIWIGAVLLVVFLLLVWRGAPGGQRSCTVCLGNGYMGERFRSPRCPVCEGMGKV